MVDHLQNTIIDMRICLSADKVGACLLLPDGWIDSLEAWRPKAGMTYVRTVAKWMEIVAGAGGPGSTRMRVRTTFSTFTVLASHCSVGCPPRGTVLAQASLLATTRAAVAATDVPRPGASSNRSKDTRTERVGKSALDALPCRLRWKPSPAWPPRRRCILFQSPASKTLHLEGSGRCGQEAQGLREARILPRFRGFAPVPPPEACASCVGRLLRPVRVAPRS